VSLIEEDIKSESVFPGLGYRFGFFSTRSFPLCPPRFCEKSEKHRPLQQSQSNRASTISDVFSYRSSKKKNDCRLVEGCFPFLSRRLGQVVVN